MALLRMLTPPMRRRLMSRSVAVGWPPKQEGGGYGPRFCLMTKHKRAKLALEVFIELLRGRTFRSVSKTYGFPNSSRCVIWRDAVWLINKSPFALPKELCFYDDLHKMREHAHLWKPAAIKLLEALRAVD
jgi:hypothetical protein